MKKQIIKQAFKRTKERTEKLIVKIFQSKSDLSWEQYEKLEYEVKRPTRSCDVRSFHG